MTNVHNVNDALGPENRATENFTCFIHYDSSKSFGFLRLHKPVQSRT